MSRHQLIYATSLSNGLSLASLLDVLRGVNWQSLLVFGANILVSLYTWRKAEVAEQRRRDSRPEN